jgi:hypothetical protein
MKRPSDEAGVALPTALLGMLVLLMLGGLFVAYANPLQRQTAQAQAFETGLHVAESSAELAIAALADPSQPAQPFIAATAAPADRAGARQWAVDLATSRVDATCTNFQTTAGGDGTAIVDGVAGTVYGVSFLPSCQNPRTVRVMRVAYDNRPLRPQPGTVGILTGGDIHFSSNNTRILSGGLHANGNIIGSPKVDSDDGEYVYSAGGTCSVAEGCTPNAAKKVIPNYSARKFWDVRSESGTNPTNEPFYELCPDGVIRLTDPDPAVTIPCQGDATMERTLPGWEFSDTGGSRNWTWTQNAGPPDAQYYAYRTNIINEMNNGKGNSSRASFFAEVDPAHDETNNSGSGSILFTQNPKFFPSWPGVGVIADVDVMVEKNLRAEGEMTLVFAREQFRIDFNGSFDRIQFMACDQALGSTSYDVDDPECRADGPLNSSIGSPVDITALTKQSSYDNPLDGTAIVPNLGITGVADWEVL